MKRNYRIEVLLTADASRREQQKKEGVSQKAQAEINAPKFKPVDSTSEALIYKRFERDLA